MANTIVTYHPLLTEKQKPLPSLVQWYAIAECCTKFSLDSQTYAPFSTKDAFPKTAVM